MNFISAILSGIIFVSALCGGSAKSLPSSSSSSDLATCNDPAREQLENLWQIHGSWHESIFQLENMDSVGTTRDDVNPDFVSIKQHALRDSACPFGNGSKLELENYRKKMEGRASLCPSHDMINYDENRIPSTLFEKRCSCPHCGFLESSRRSSRRHSGSSTLGCQPVYYYAKVLRRVNCVDNVFVYRATLEPLAVACVCDHQSRHSADSDRPIRIHSQNGGSQSSTDSPKRNRVYSSN